MKTNFLFVLFFVVLLVCSASSEPCAAWTRQRKQTRQDYRKQNRQCKRKRNRNWSQNKELSLFAPRNEIIKYFGIAICTRKRKTGDETNQSRNHAPKNDHVWCYGGYDPRNEYAPMHHKTKLCALYKLHKYIAICLAIFPILQSIYFVL